MSGLYTARSLAAAGADVLVIEAQGRVGGRTLTIHFSDGTFVDDGGQWVSPGQHCIVKLADELGIRLFPSWSEGATVHWRAGKRSISNDLFLPDDGDAAIVAPEESLTVPRMVAVVPWANKCPVQSPPETTSIAATRFVRIIKPPLWNGHYHISDGADGVGFQPAAWEGRIKRTPPCRISKGSSFSGGDDRILLLTIAAIFFSFPA